METGIAKHLIQNLEMSPLKGLRRRVTRGVPKTVFMSRYEVGSLLTLTGEFKLAAVFKNGPEKNCSVRLSLKVGVREENGKTDFINWWHFQRYTAPAPLPTA